MVPVNIRKILALEGCRAQHRRWASIQLRGVAQAQRCACRQCKDQWAGRAGDWSFRLLQPRHMQRPGGSHISTPLEGPAWQSSALPMLATYHAYRNHGVCIRLSREPECPGVCVHVHACACRLLVTARGGLQSQFGTFFSSPCQQTTVTIPSSTPEWTCGLKLSGTFNCAGKPLQREVYATSLPAT